ncbi:ankyrin [Lojkania enalia]|uniref:Ankyrin n=1 Tax=Lojkania enalia TaxID=147567 RepID=A0A9P4N0I4_9PLEO|nr:ankyrin [Didymosphaeria enalia]
MASGVQPSSLLQLPKASVYIGYKRTLAAERGFIAVVSLLLAKYGVDPDPKDKNGRTPLSWAAERGFTAAISLLLAKTDDKDGRTPLSWAAGEGYGEILKQLLAKDGVDLDSKDKDGRTPLSWAAGGGHGEIVKQLLAKDVVNPDSKDKDGRTPLSWAGEKGNMAVIQQLAKDGIGYGLATVRMDWICCCGYYGYDYFIEQKPCAVKHLAERLKSSHAVITAELAAQISIPKLKYLSFITQNLLHSLTRRFRDMGGQILPVQNSSATIQSQSRRRLDQDTSGEGNGQTSQDTPIYLGPSDTSGHSRVSDHEDYMLLCINDSQWGTTRDDMSVAAITSDHELFDVMRSRYFLHRGQLRRWLSIQTLQRIIFVKVSVDSSIR